MDPSEQPLDSVRPLLDLGRTCLAWHGRVQEGAQHNLACASSSLQSSLAHVRLQSRCTPHCSTGACF